MSPAWLEDSKKKDLNSDANPTGVDVRADRPASTDQQRSPSAVNRPQGNSLHLFVRKVYRLMSRRLRELCTTLDISDELRLKVWTCFEHSLVHCTHLMVDRHLDQMLMCAIYITAKITKVEIPFKHIMKCYKSQTHAGKSVCKNVLISGDAENSITENNNNRGHSNSIPTPDSPSTHYPGSPHEQRGNLIYFYNQVYTTEMQHFVKQFAPNSGGDTPPLSPYPLQWRASPQRHQLSSSPNIYISPYRPENLSPTRTTSLCYYFNSSPPERLREINNMVKTGRSPTRRRYVVSLDEEGEDSPSAKRLRLDDQSAWQRRLRNVVNDRVTTRMQDQSSPVTKAKLH
ncbi:hypothetical protein INR49_020269 [Caranx melampygus]|nr:hypothetical protein INR49_020269 [Caranx melampygus]